MSTTLHNNENGPLSIKKLSQSQLVLNAVEENFENC